MLETHDGRGNGGRYSGSAQSVGFAGGLGFFNGPDGVGGGHRMTIGGPVGSSSTHDRAGAFMPALPD